MVRHRDDPATNGDGAKSIAPTEPDEGEFPALEAAIVHALQVFAVGFAGTGMAPGIVVERTAVFVAALQGIVTQILHKRFKVAPSTAKAFIADTCRMLIKGVS